MEEEPRLRRYWTEGEVKVTTTITIEIEDEIYQVRCTGTRITSIVLFGSDGRRGESLTFSELPEPIRDRLIEELE